MNTALYSKLICSDSSKSGSFCGLLNTLTCCLKYSILNTNCKDDEFLKSPLSRHSREGENPEVTEITKSKSSLISRLRGNDKKTPEFIITFGQGDGSGRGRTATVRKH